MNEIANTLKENSVETAFPLELPTLDDLVDVQEEILVTLPVEFRDYLMHCSDVIYGELEPVTIADPHSNTYLPEVTSEAWEQGMPREYVALCQIDDGYYCVAQDGTIWLWHNGDDDAQQVCDDVWQWVRDIWLEGASF